jgi:hypothetical protein
LLSRWLFRCGDGDGVLIWGVAVWTGKGVALMPSYSCRMKTIR